jgi:glutamyl-tRNA(Gln) amidotransferase subunit E
LQQRGVMKALLGVPGKWLPWIESPLVLEATGALRSCDYPPVRDAMQKGETVAALRLPQFGRLLDRRTQPGITFASEFADRVRVIACLAGRTFMVDSDTGGGLRPEEWRELRTALRADRWDAIVVVWGPRDDVATAVREVFLRAQDALEGVPSETRQAYADGTNGFERILPGPDRMYPDTDTPPVAIADDTVQEIRAARPERPWERVARYEALGLDGRAARRLAGAA